MNNLQITYAYLAGIVDGEGYVGINKRVPTAANRMTAVRYFPRVSVAMTDIEPLELLSATFGLGVPSARKRQDQHQIIYSVDASSDKAALVISALLPYLRVKRIQAEKCIELHELGKSPERRGKRIEIRFKSGPLMGRKGVRWGLSDEYVARCDELYESCLGMAIRKTSNSNGRVHLPDQRK